MGWDAKVTAPAATGVSSVSTAQTQPTTLQQIAAQAERLLDCAAAGPTRTCFACVLTMPISALLPAATASWVTAA